MGFGVGDGLFSDAQFSISSILFSDAQFSTIKKKNLIPSAASLYPHCDHPAEVVIESKQALPIRARFGAQSKHTDEDTYGACEKNICSSSPDFM